ncbi:MAG: NAD(P)-binding domain-containing protein [Burkholderiales bacterium]|nr:NAD(P)-binding domain-containing protein [Anaerolineae bacterium]
MTSIGIIGTGKMGTGLGRVWAAAGNRVFFGSRDADKAKALAAEIGFGARGGTFEDAVDHSNISVLAVPGFAAESVALELAGNLSNERLIDLTNPMSQTGFGLSVGTTTSMAEIIADHTKAYVAKAFNTIHYLNLENPVIDGIRADVYYCGDDPAKFIAKQLIIDAGFEPVDCGPLQAARYIEPLAGLWIHLAFGMGGKRETAFKLLGR